MRGVGMSLAMAVFVLMAPPRAQSSPPAAPARPASNPKVAAALQTLDDIEAQVARAGRDVRAVRRQAEALAKGRGASFAPPDSLLRRIDRLGRHVDATLRPLRGQPWIEVRPTLRRAEQLHGRLRQMREKLAAPVTPRARPGRSGRASSLDSGSGVITGHVVDARNGAPLDATVELYDLSGTLLGSYAASAGTYSIQGLATGTYFLRADSNSDVDYIGELYNDIPCDYYCDITSGTPVTVIDGQVTAGVDFALLPFSTASGTVLDATTGQPLTEVEIWLYDPQGSFAGFTYTGTDGTYRFRRLTAGTYFAVARDWLYLDQLYSGLACQPTCTPQSGTPILVGPGVNAGGIDFAMQLGGSVSGTVTDEATANPVEGDVELYDGSGAWVDSASVTSTGQYQVFDLPTGSYFALTFSWDYADELYDNLPCESGCTITDGTPIAVMQGQEHAGVSFALASIYGGISGSVSDAANGLPIAGVYVYAVDAGGILVGSRNTSPAGAYQLRGLAAGSYHVYASSDTYVDELYDNVVCEPSCVPTAGTPVVVLAGADTGNIDFALDFGGWITGHVVSTVGTPIEGALVTVYRSDGTAVDPSPLGTDETGAYVQLGLVTGSYYAVARNSDFVAELYRELPCPEPCDPASGTAISVTTSQATNGIDFTPSRLGRISGRVTEAGTGLPVVASIQVHPDPPGGVWESIDYMGNYVVWGLPAGTYFVWTDSSMAGNYVDQLYANKTCEPSCDVTQGTPVTVALDSTTTGIDLVLRRPVFADVPVDHWAWKWVEAAYAAGITGGCATGPLRFCPDAAVTRDQSAVVLLRAKEGPTYVPPPATGVFQDVPVSSGFAPWVEELSRRGVTAGCSTNPPLFCPGVAVTRAQSAPFLLRTHDGATYVPPAAVGVFADVPPSDPFARWIEELVRRGVTAGCSTNPSLFCPGASVTRAQFSVFLGRTFGLTLP